MFESLLVQYHMQKILRMFRGIPHTGKVKYLPDNLLQKICSGKHSFIALGVLEEKGCIETSYHYNAEKPDSVKWLGYSEVYILETEILCRNRVIAYILGVVTSILVYFMQRLLTGEIQLPAL